MQTHTSPLKWVGGKQRLLADLIPLLPAGQCLIEPFVGAGSVFAATHYPSYLLNDNNADLINLYRVIQNQADDLIVAGSALFVPANLSKEAFETLRSQFNFSATNPVERAALMIYLNRFGFNGLYRTNLAGHFNAPFGHRMVVPSFPVEAILRHASLLKCAVITCDDFEIVMDKAVPGDVVYCDPPYADSENGKSFTSYGKSRFDWTDHERLADKALELSSHGITVVISNHDTWDTRQLYRCAEIRSLTVRRSIAATAESRGCAHELVAIFVGERKSSVHVDHGFLPHWSLSCKSASSCPLAA